MGIARVSSRAQVGLAAPPVEVEVHLGSGLPVFSIVGLPATVVKESKDRVRAALHNCGFDFPAGRITVNLSPADLPKEGCRYDLPIALGILLASSQLDSTDALLARSEFYGELGLAGELKPIKGALLAAAHAARAGRGVVMPLANLAEARLAAPVPLEGVATLLDACAMFGPRNPVAAPAILPSALSETELLLQPSTDLDDVRGQAAPKRALIVAAAGGHSLLLIGPPGTGKSMLAQRLPGLLPPLDGDEALDVAAIASVSNYGFDARDYGRRPFRAPHHTASAGAIIGGGPRARPGEVSLAHRGVLFLDELPEFDRRVLESLREPLETGVVAISRAALKVEYPARFQLVAAMNPCPCGYLGDTSGRCRCAPPEISRYRSRISGPLLDRIDIRVEVANVESEELLGEHATMSTPSGSARAAQHIRKAREVQRSRSSRLNAHLSGAEIQQACALDRRCRSLLAQARTKLSMSARGLHRVLRVARTIADLEMADLEMAGQDVAESPLAETRANLPVSPAHLAEALQWRREIA